MKFLERLEIRWILFSAWLLLVVVGSVLVSRRALNDYRHLLFVTKGGVYWAWPAASKLHYVARRTLSANHRLVDSDLERPKTPWSVQIDEPTKDLLDHFLRHEVLKAKPVAVEDVSANPYLGEIPENGTGVVLLPSPIDAPKLRDSFTIGQDVTVVSSELKVRTRGRIVAVGNGQVLISMPAPCATLLAGKNVQGVTTFTSSLDLGTECPDSKK